MVRKLILPTLAAVLSLVLGASLAAQGEKSDTNQPQVSGTMQGNVGCAVLEKHTPVKGKLLALGVIYARTEYKVLATFNATLPRDKFTGPGEIKDLNDLAVKDKIKLVILRSNYSDAEFAQARSMCGQPATPPANPNPPAPPPSPPAP
jgi:hypothetical protein